MDMKNLVFRLLIIWWIGTEKKKLGSASGADIPTSKQSKYLRGKVIKKGKHKVSDVEMGAIK